MARKLNTYIITYVVKGSAKKHQREANGYAQKEEKVKMISSRPTYKVVSVKIAK